METYNGHVRTPTDAIILFEACRLGLLPRVQRRLSEKERQSIRSGSVFVWDEREAGMRRWTDGKSWSASRVSGSFLTYREMEGKRGSNTFAAPTVKVSKVADGSGEDQGDASGGDPEEGPDGYRYKPDGLMKQSFSITTSQGQHLHLISYYSRSHPTSQILRQPSTDPSLSSIKPAPGMYPESTVNDQSSVPAVTRSPMPGAPNYVMAPSPAYARPGVPPPPPPHGYIPAAYIPHPGYMYPLSPMHTPPGHYVPPYGHPAPGLPPLAYPPPHYAQPPHPLLTQAPPSSYDQRPLRGVELRQSQPPPAPVPSGIISPPATNTHHSQSQPPPASYPPADYPPTPNSLKPPSLLSEKTYGAQNDAASNQTNSIRLNGSSPKIGSTQPGSKPTENGVTSASLVPTIDALVHGPRSNSSDDRPQAETEKDRRGSTSPGGTKRSAPPQDIPSEKLGFREDIRALSKLDRVFARV